MNEDIKRTEGIENNTYEIQIIPSPQNNMENEPEEPFIDDGFTYGAHKDILNHMDVIPSRAKNRGKRGRFPKAIASVSLIAVIVGGALGAGYHMGSAAMSDEAGRMMAELRNEMAQSIEQEFDTLITASALSDITGSNIVNTAAFGEADSYTVADVVRNASNSVVSITAIVNSKDFFGRTYEAPVKGSGIIFKEDAEKIYIVTNYHVVDGAKKVNISLDDTNEVEANYVGGDENNDIAVISVTKTNLNAAGITGYTLAEFADSGTINIGDAAIAIGNAAGEGKSATFGIISAVDRVIQIDAQTELTVIQTDAAINPGNSGGALLDMNGYIVGISTAKLSETGYEGMGYAIPSNTVVQIIDSILGKGSVKVPYIGISSMATVTEQVQRAYNFSTLGVYVNSVENSSPAQEAGLRNGDIITAINGERVLTTDDVQRIVSGSEVGGKLELSIVRNGGNSYTLTVIVGNRGLNF